MIVSDVQQKIRISSFPNDLGRAYPRREIAPQPLWSRSRSSAEGLVPASSTGGAERLLVALDCRVEPGNDSKS